jgi:hypothetical protein
VTPMNAKPVPDGAFFCARSRAFWLVKTRSVENLRGSGMLVVTDAADERELHPEGQTTCLGMVDAITISTNSWRR